jgi:hypothetical protein
MYVVYGDEGRQRKLKKDGDMQIKQSKLELT